MCGKRLEQVSNCLCKLFDPIYLIKSACTWLDNVWPAGVLLYYFFHAVICVCMSVGMHACVVDCMIMSNNTYALTFINFLFLIIYL